MIIKKCFIFFFFIVLIIFGVNDNIVWWWNFVINCLFDFICIFESFSVFWINGVKLLFLIFCIFFKFVMLYEKNWLEYDFLIGII